MNEKLLLELVAEVVHLKAENAAIKEFLIKHISDGDKQKIEDAIHDSVSESFSQSSVLISDALYPKIRALMKKKFGYAAYTLLRKE